MQSAMNALEKAWLCGKRLSAMKELVGHGNWLPYLESHIPKVSVSTAQRYMKIDRDNPNAARVRELNSTQSESIACRWRQRKSKSNIPARDIPAAR